MVTSRPVPQQTAQIFSPLEGQNRSGLRFSQIGQDTNSPLQLRQISRIRVAFTKDKIRNSGSAVVVLTQSWAPHHAHTPRLGHASQAKWLIH